MFLLIFNLHCSFHLILNISSFAYQCLALSTVLPSVKDV